MRKALQLLSFVALAGVPFTAQADAPARKIGWNELRTADSAATQPVTDASATLSWDLEGKTVELAGYVLPSDREGDLVYQFLLIPWTGLCSHVPPPPPNQAVLITLKDPYRLSETYQTVSVTGVLKPALEKTQLFILDGVSVIESGYTIGSAAVAPADKVVGAEPPPPSLSKSNPGSFLGKKTGG